MDRQGRRSPRSIVAAGLLARHAHEQMNNPLRSSRALRENILSGLRGSLPSVEESATVFANGTTRATRKELRDTVRP